MAKKIIFQTRKNVQKNNHFVCNKTMRKENPEKKSLYARVMHLQRTIGNRAVNRLLTSGVLQAKLQTERPGSRYEQKTDRVSDTGSRLQVYELPHELQQMSLGDQRHSQGMRKHIRNLVPHNNMIFRMFCGSEVFRHSPGFSDSADILPSLDIRTWPCRIETRNDNYFGQYDFVNQLDPNTHGRNVYRFRFVVNTGAEVLEPPATDLRIKFTGTTQSGRFSSLREANVNQSTMDEWQQSTGPIYHLESPPSPPTDLQYTVRLDPGTGWELYYGVRDQTVYPGHCFNRIIAIGSCPG